MHPDQQARKAWADRFRTVVALAIRHHLGDMAEIADADDDLDRKRATDYVVELSHPHVACRIRCCDERDVTIRVPGEEAKLEAGYVSHYFYGWAETRDDVNLAAWLLFRVRPFVDSGVLRMAREIRNRDGRSSFKPVLASDLFTIPGCVIESQGLVVPADAPRLFWPAGGPA